MDKCFDGYEVIWHRAEGLQEQQIIEYQYMPKLFEIIICPYSEVLQSLLSFVVVRRYISLVLSFSQMSRVSHPFSSFFHVQFLYFLLLYFLKNFIHFFSTICNLLFVLCWLSLISHHSKYIVHLFLFPIYHILQLHSWSKCYSLSTYFLIFLLALPSIQIIVKMYIYISIVKV